MRFYKQALDWWLTNHLQQYVKSPNKDFVASTIQAIGKCAMTVPDMANRCLKGLMKLLTSSNGMVLTYLECLLNTCQHFNIRFSCCRIRFGYQETVANPW